MAEETNYAPDRVSVITCSGSNYIDVPHSSFDTRGGMVYLVGLDVDDEEMRSVMIPTSNVRRVDEYHTAVEEEEEAEEVREEVESQDTEVEMDPSVPEGDAPNLLDLTVDEIEEALAEYDYRDEYLSWLVDEDERVTATDLYADYLA